MKFSKILVDNVLNVKFPIICNICNLLRELKISLILKEFFIVVHKT